MKASFSPCRFSFCQFPFILSPVVKKSIIQKESEQQMISEARVRHTHTHAFYVCVYLCCCKRVLTRSPVFVCACACVFCSKAWSLKFLADNASTWTFCSSTLKCDGHNCSATRWMRFVHESYTHKKNLNEAKLLWAVWNMSLIQCNRGPTKTSFWNQKPKSSVFLKEPSTLNVSFQADS